MTNLPAYVNAFVGRDHQLELITTAIRSEGARLLTLTGPGGTGKTRLALLAASSLVGDFPDGVFVVWLASISNPDRFTGAIAQALGLSEPPGGSLFQRLVDFLTEKKLLLVLDNFEHVTPSAVAVAELLGACSALHALVTSRVVLNLYGERHVPVPPLALPDHRTTPTAEYVCQFESIRLFVDRAQAVRPDFELLDANAVNVAQICQRLDGLPLALELAAARLQALSVASLAERIDHRLPLLTGGPRDRPARQRTLRDTIAWSYDLLDPAGQTLFRRLAVFEGCTIDAANEVCCVAAAEPGSSTVAVTPLTTDLIDCLTTLVDNSLLIRGESATGEARYAMLETIREYALERLAETDEADAIRRRHALFYLALAESAEPELTGEAQAEWAARLELDYPNLANALVWCEARGYAEPALRLAVALWWFWAVRGRATEGRDRLQRLLDRFKPRAAPERYVLARARASQALGNLVAFHGNYRQAQALHERAVADFRALADAQHLEGALQALGWVTSRQGDHTQAIACLEEAVDLARSRGDAAAIGAALFNLAYARHESGDYALARQLLGEAMALKRETGREASVGVIQIMLGVVAQDEGELARARSWCEEGLRLCRAAGDERGIALGLADLASLAIAQRDYEEARASLGESIAIYERIGEPVGVAFVLERFARLAEVVDQAFLAVKLAGAAAALRGRIGAPLGEDAEARLNTSLARARRILGEPAAAEAWNMGWALTPEQAVHAALEPLRLQSTTRGSTAKHTGDLTPREREVAVLIARGYTNHRISSELVITEATAASHVVHILAKLAFSSRAQIAAWAVEHDLLRPDTGGSLHAIVH